MAVIVQSLMVVRPHERETIAHVQTFHVERPGSRPSPEDVIGLERRVRRIEDSRGWARGELTWMAWQEAHRGDV